MPDLNLLAQQSQRKPASLISTIDHSQYYISNGIELEIDSAYGWSNKSIKGQFSFSCTDQIIYVCGRYIVMHNISTGAQSIIPVDPCVKEISAMLATKSIKKSLLHVANKGPKGE